jgi:uncharacterized protein YbjT (DUF2867 family)
MVHPKDIAAGAAEELQNNFTGHSIRYIASDERKTSEVAQVLGAAVGKPALPWIEFSDTDAEAGMIKAGLPPVVAKMYVEMGNAASNGSMFEDYAKHKPTLSPTKLEDFAKEFAVVYEAAK